jgi:hypothetical protein
MVIANSSSLKAELSCKPMALATTDEGVGVPIVPDADAKAKNQATNVSSNNCSHQIG